MPTNKKPAGYDEAAKAFAAPFEKARDEARLVLSGAAKKAAETMQATMCLTNADKAETDFDLLKLRFEASKEIAKAVGVYSEKEAISASNIVINVSGEQALKIERFASLTEEL